jgi:AcrR family transcriptional regulator
MVQGVCDYLAGAPGMDCARQLQMEPHMEAAVIAVVRAMLLNGMKQHPPAQGISPEMLAATLSWAIYGAAKEWLRTPGRAPSDAVVDQVMRLVQPIFTAAYATHS